MITLEIIQSIDTKKMGHFTFHQNEISLGVEMSNDLPVPLDENHTYLIQIKENSLFLTTPENVIVHVNKLRTTGTKTLRREDLIEIDTIQLVIKDFRETQFTSRKEKLNENAEKLSQNHPDLIPILQELSTYNG